MHCDIQDNGDDMESMTEPSLFHSNYSNKKTGENVDVLDVCSGNLNHVNLKQVVGGFIFKYAKAHMEFNKFITIFIINIQVIFRVKSG
jgi:hypothetical protein